MAWGKGVKDHGLWSIRCLKGKQTVEKEAEKRSLKFRCKYGRMMTIFTNSTCQRKSSSEGATLTLV